MATAKIEHIRNEKYVPNGTKSYVSALIKYGFTTTLPGPYYNERASILDTIVGLAEKAVGHSTTHKTKHHRTKKQNPTTGESEDVTAQDQQNDSEYLVPVSIGTPAQTLHLDFDTGSSDLWVFSTELPAATQSQAGSSHTIFNPQQSSTFQQTSGSTWSISYGDGSSASGDVGTDAVTIGDITIPNQSVELAKVLSSEFASGPGDGLLGLAWPAINTVTPTPVATPVENMISENLIPQGLFTAHLGSWRQATTTDAGSSFYTFGFIDSTTESASAPTYTPVDNSQGFWQFDSASASINGSTVARSGNTAIADTGTTLALVDDSLCKQIYAAIPGSTYDSTQQGYLFPTSVTPAQLPVVSFAVGDAQFTLPKEALSFASAGNNMVYGGVQSRGTMTFDILGDTFLKGIVAVFDQANTQFGAIQRPDATGDTLEPPPTS